jgi:ElaA protein
MFQCLHFDELSPLQLYKILYLRSKVFIIEQNCLYADIDQIDPLAYQVFAINNNNCIACTRLMAPKIVYNEISIGRVAVDIDHRKLGIGKKIIEFSIDKCYLLFGKKDIKIGAQLYLKKFYENLGFMQSSTMYLEDGIEHIYMIKKA